MAWMTGRWSLRLPVALWLAACLVLASPAARAATPWLDLTGSPDVSLETGGALVRDSELVVDDGMGGVVVLVAPGAAAPVSAYATLPNGDELFVFETAVVLPGNPTSFTARPGDVVAFQGSIYTPWFDAAAAGLPRGARTDAVTVIAGDLLLSFDTPVDIGGGAVAHDEDLVRWDGVSLAPFWDGSAFGVAPGLDLDAAHHVEANGHLLLSFDGGGQLGGVDFGDEDVLEFDPGTGAWSLAYDASAQSAGWAAADFDALDVTSDVDDDGLADAVETDTGIFVDANDTGTDPLLADSDDDGIPDGVEVAGGTDPNDPDDPGGNPEPNPTLLPSLGPAGAAALVLLMSLLAVRGLRKRRSGRIS